MSANKILLVDDEPDILEIMSYNLAKEGYEIFTAENGEEALKIAKIEKPQLVVLDVMMPVLDGLETCTEMRKIQSLQNTLIVFLSARSEEFSQLAAFDAGANDYITKPVKPKILVSKINALLKLVNKDTHKKEISLGDLKINSKKHSVKWKDEKIDLPKKEFKLLSLLTSEPNRVFTRDEILSKVWGNEVIVGGRTIDVHIRKIRERLGNDRIVTIKGVGYKYAYDEN